MAYVEVLEMDQAMAIVTQTVMAKLMVMVKVAVGVVAMVYCQTVTTHVGVDTAKDLVMAMGVVAERNRAVIASGNAAWEPLR